MMKKLFALASVTALGGFVAFASAAGCSSSEIISQPGEALPGDGGKKDARPAPPPPEEQTPPAETCKAKEAFTPAETKPPAPQSGTACTDAGIDALAGACAEDPNAEGCTSARDQPANKTCAQCIFGKKDDAEWKVINLMPGETPSARYNQEGCVEHITGVKGCGIGYLKILDCFNNYCSKCPDNELQTCLEEVAEGDCRQHRIADTACATALSSKQDAIDACFPANQEPGSVKTLFVNMSKIACKTAPGGGAKDGG